MTERGTVDGRVARAQRTRDAVVDALLEQRARILEVGTGVYRAAVLQEPFSPTMANNMAIGRKLARAELESVFAPEIARLREPESQQLLDALEITTNAAT